MCSIKDPERYFTEVRPTRRGGAFRDFRGEHGAPGGCNYALLCNYTAAVIENDRLGLRDFDRERELRIPIHPCALVQLQRSIPKIAFSQECVSSFLETLYERRHVRASGRHTVVEAIKIAISRKEIGRRPETTEASLYTRLIQVAHRIP